MAFDPDAYLASKAQPVQSGGGFNPDAYLASKAAPVQSTPWGSVASQAASNFIPSVGHVIGGVVNSVIHPIDTISGLADLGVGAVQSALPQSLQADSAQPQRDKAKLVADYYKQKYGSEEGFKQALAKDPASVLMDASVALSGGASLASKLSSLPKLGSLSGASDALNTAATVSNPIVGTAKLAAMPIKAISNTWRAQPEVAQLAQRASDLGIDIPADRLVNSPALNATAASLRYMPFSGRVGTEAKMEGQIKQALSNTIGQDTPNMTVELMKDAKAQLGQKFDDVLKNNNVIVDDKLKSDLLDNLTAARKELNPEQYARVKNQVDDLLGKTLVKDDASNSSATLADLESHAAQMPDAGVLKQPHDFTIPENGANLLTEIRKLGGVSLNDAKDLMGEKQVTKVGAQVGVFTKNGEEVGDIVRRLVDKGVIPKTVLEDVDGGAQYLRDAIQKSVGSGAEDMASRAAAESYYGSAPDLPLDPLSKFGKPAGIRQSPVENSDLIQGQAAYNVKKTLDRIGTNSDTSLAYHAKQVRASLMSALNRSLDPATAAEFAKTRTQYQNLKSLEPLIQNGAEGNISMARLGNIKGNKSAQIQALADIAAQFAKGRESPHGAMQRVAMGAAGTAAMGTGALTGYLAPVVAGLTAGRGANMLLNSQILKNHMLSNGAKLSDVGLSAANEMGINRARLNNLAEFMRGRNPNNISNSLYLENQQNPRR